MFSRTRIIIAAVALGTSLTAGGLALAGSEDPKGSLSCVAPLDATGIDRVLQDAGSPLAGEGSTFVTAAASVGLDPRALVAIAGHETILMTYGPAARINNPFGIGPGRRFASPADAIRSAATLISTGYVGQGLTTLSAISGKYAPVGVSNDPGNLNANWAGGVGTLYGRLGGDPGAAITLNAQPSSCDDTAASPAVGTSSPAATSGTSTTPSDTTAPALKTWDGTVPTIASDTTDAGADPLTGQAATVDGFVFPLLVGTTPPTVDDDYSSPGTGACSDRAIRCAVTVVARRGDGVVASVSGQLASATADEQSAGVAFWITTRSGDRFGYGPLLTYEPGIADGASVTAGQPLGTTTPRLTFAWERSGSRIDPAPLLSATLR